MRRSMALKRRSALLASLPQPPRRNHVESGMKAQAAHGEFPFHPRHRAGQEPVLHFGLVFGPAGRGANFALKLAELRSGGHSGQRGGGQDGRKMRQNFIGNCTPSQCCLAPLRPASTYQMDEKAGLRRGCDRLPTIDALKAQWKGTGL